MAWLHLQQRYGFPYRICQLYGWPGYWRRGGRVRLFDWGITVNKRLPYAFALAALPRRRRRRIRAWTVLEDPIADSLTSGVTVYGTIDVGYSYEPMERLRAASSGRTPPTTFTWSECANRAISSLESQAIEQSFIGIKVVEAIGGGWVGIARLETSFDPYTGTMNDGPKSLLLNTGAPLSQQSANRELQPRRAGLQRPGLWRRASAAMLMERSPLDGMSHSRAMFSANTTRRIYPTHFPCFAGHRPRRAGIAEASNVDHSVKYAFRYGPVHAAGVCSAGVPDPAF